MPVEARESGFMPRLLALDPGIFVIAGARCINTLGFSMVLPFLGIHMVEDRGLLATAWGTILTAQGVTSAIGQAIAGELADRVGRRVLMASALAGRTLIFLGLGAAISGRASLPLIIGLILLNGLLRAQFDPAANAAVTDMAPPHLRTVAYGVQRVGVNLGWAIGPALGGALAPHSYGAMFYVAAPFTAAAALAILRLRERPRALQVPTAPAPDRTRLGAILSANRRFVVYLILVFLGTSMTVQFFSTLTLYAKTELLLSKAQIGLLYTVNGLLVVLLQLPATVFIDARGPKRALLLGPTMYAIAYVGVGFASGFSALALAIVVLTAGEVVFAPALADMAAHLGDPKRLGRAFGLFGLMQQMGVSIGPLVGGAIYDGLHDHHLAMWGTIAAGTALVGLGYLVFALTWRDPHGMRAP